MLIQSEHDYLELTVIEAVPEGLPTEGDLHVQVRVKSGPFTAAQSVRLEAAAVQHFRTQLTQLEASHQGSALLESYIPQDFKLEIYCESPNQPCSIRVSLSQYQIVDTCFLRQWAGSISIPHEHLAFTIRRLCTALGYTGTCSPKETLSTFNQLQPWQFGILKSIRMDQSSDPGTPTLYDIQLLLASNKVDGSQLSVMFIGAFDITIQLPTFSNDILLEIQDIRDQQWEGAHYRVTDAEQGAFSFVCRDFLAERLQTGRGNMHQ
ncbi:hypothetical protein [Leeia sp.]|uniref:hypothetical protein n=1 Tax=Leeia sp. TaxID=2884678 RepID=UPI0035B0114F